MNKPKPKTIEADIGEAAGTAEGLQVALVTPRNALVELQRGTPHFPCPECGSVSKPHHGPGERICFNKSCLKGPDGGRTVFTPKDEDAEYLPVSGPAYPCKTCGKETKEHHGGGRICSNKTCSARLATLKG